MPVAILVIDVRGYTSLSEKISGQQLALKMNTFFEEATEIMMRFDALIDKYLGDAVQALWLKGVAGGDYIQNAVSAAEGLAEHFREKLPVGVAVHYGEAFVGNVGAVGMIDLTAMGDVVNTTHRLQAHAAEGQVIVSEAVYEVMGRPAGWEFRFLELKGKAEPMKAWLKEHPVSSEFHER